MLIIGSYRCTDIEERKGLRGQKKRQRLNS